MSRSAWWLRSRRGIRRCCSLPGNSRPALAAGNTVVIKPSEFTSASALEFVKLVEEAGFPPGVVNVVTGFGKEVGTPLVEHPLVRKSLSPDRIRPAARSSKRRRAGLQEGGPGTGRQVAQHRV